MMKKNDPVWYRRKSLWWVIVSVVLGGVSAYYYPAEELTDTKIASKLTVLVAVATVVLAIFGIFLTILFGDLMRKVFQSGKGLNAKERDLMGSFKFTLFSSVGVLSFVCMLIVWGDILESSGLGIMVENYSESKVFFERLLVGFVHTGITLEMFAVVYAIYPLIKVDGDLNVESIHNEIDASMFTVSDE